MFLGGRCGRASGEVGLHFDDHVAMSGSDGGDDGIEDVDDGKRRSGVEDGQVDNGTWVQVSWAHRLVPWTAGFFRIGC